MNPQETPRDRVVAATKRTLTDLRRQPNPQSFEHWKALSSDGDQVATTVGSHLRQIARLAGTDRSGVEEHISAVVDAVLSVNGGGLSKAAGGLPSEEVAAAVAEAVFQVAGGKGTETVAPTKSLA